MPASTQDILIESAVRLFHEKGYAATGVSEILRAAGANPGSLYHFFPGKEAILLRVLEWYEDHLRPIVLDPIEAAEADPIQRVFALLAWYRDGMELSGCRLGCPVGQLALEVSDTHPAARPLIDRNFQNWAAGIEAWLEAARDRLPRECDLHALSLFVLTVMEGGLMQSRAAGHLAPFDASVAILRDHFDCLQDARRREPGDGESTHEGETQ